MLDPYDLSKQNNKVMVMSLYQSERKEMLKRRSRRKQLIDQLSRYIHISENSFLDPIENDEFVKIIFNKMDKVINRVQIPASGNLKRNIQLSKQYLEEIFIKNCFPEDVLVFFFTEYEVEATKLKSKDVTINLNHILDLSTFSTGYGDFIVVNRAMNFGFCIERTEYNYEVLSWKESLNYNK